MTDKQKLFILEHYGSTQTNVIASYLGCSTTSVLRWAKRLGLVIRKPNTAFNPTLEQKEYICLHYGKIPARLIADVLGTTAASVRTFAKRLGLRITKEQLADLKNYGNLASKNPNPITDTTKMLICRYYYEGDTIDLISFQLGRTKEDVTSILRECLNNGLFQRYNLFGHLIKSEAKKSGSKSPQGL